MKLLSFYERINIQFDVTEITIQGRSEKYMTETIPYFKALGSACNNWD